MQKRQTCARASTCDNSLSVAHESCLLRYSPYALEFTEAIPIINENRLPLLSENNFQTPSFIWTPPLIDI